MEIALALPVIVFVLLGGVDVSRAFAVQLAIQNAARAGAEAALLRGDAGKAELAEHAAAELEGAPGVSAVGATVSISKETTDDVCYITVRVYHTFQTIVPWPGIPNSARIDRTVRVRDLAGPVQPGGAGSGGTGGGGNGSGSGGSNASGDTGEESGEDSDDSNEQVGGGGGGGGNDTDCDNSVESGDDPDDDGSGEGNGESGDGEAETED